MRARSSIDSRWRLAMALVLLAGVATSSTAFAEAPSIRWPSAKARAAASPGQVLTVRVVSHPHRRVGKALPAVGTLVRVGTRRRVVMKRRARHGLIKIKLPSARGVRYELRVTVAGRLSSRRVTVAPKRVTQKAPTAPVPASPAVLAPDPIQVPGPAPAPCPVGTKAATMSVQPAQAPPGATLTVTLTNTGTGCYDFGDTPGWEHQVDGAWQTMPATEPHIPIGYALTPGAATTQTVVIPTTYEPGQYRLTNGFEAARVTAEVTVLPPAP